MYSSQNKAVVVVVTATTILAIEVLYTANETVTNLKGLN